MKYVVDSPISRCIKQLTKFLQRFNLLTAVWKLIADRDAVLTRKLLAAAAVVADAVDEDDGWNDSVVKVASCAFVFREYCQSTPYDQRAIVQRGFILSDRCSRRYIRGRICE